jgi:competence protein ComEC
LDVGQGDSELITTKEGLHMIIDGGPDQKVLSELARVLPFGVQTIDIMMLSHPDADHLAGLISVLEDYQVGQVLMPDVNKDTALYRSFLTMIADKHIPSERVLQASERMIGGSLKMTILHPSPLTSQPKDPANNFSITARFDDGPLSLLFTGDLEAPIETKLVANWQPQLNVDVLKVPHHGSITSSTPAFIDAISPIIAVMEVGLNNKFHHPSPTVVYRYQARHIDLLRTDRDGPQRLCLQGNQLLRIKDQPQFWRFVFGDSVQKRYTMAQEP